MSHSPPARRLLDWTFTIPFLIAFAAILGFFDPLQRLARLGGARPHELVVGALQWSLLQALRICGTRLRVERDPAVRPRTPYVVIANHQSMFDVPILGALLFTNFPKYVAKKSLARWIPSISYNLRRGGNALIDRDDPDQALTAIRALAATVRARGVSAVIYPEGTRSRGGALRPFKARGTLELLREAPSVEVLPVAIDGSWELLRHDLLPVPFGTTVRVRIGAPIPRAAHDDAAIVRIAESSIRTALSAWRGEPDDADQPTAARRRTPGTGGPSVVR